MKRLVFICTILLLCGSCTRGYKMPKGFEQDLRAFYTQWYGENERVFCQRLSPEQLTEMQQQGDILIQKYGLKEQAVELGYFKEEIQLPNMDTEEYMQGWISRNTTAEYQRLSNNPVGELQLLTIDEIAENGKLLPIEKVQLVEISIDARR